MHFNRDVEQDEDEDLRAFARGNQSNVVHEDGDSDCHTHMMETRHPWRIPVV